MTVDDSTPDGDSAPRDYVRRLWRAHGTTPPTPRRGPRQRLQLEDVLAGAIALADAEGLSALSMRSLAGRLDVTAMSLYSYVGSKEDLLGLIQDTALGPVPTDPPQEQDVAAEVQEWASRLFARYVAHPWLCDLNWAESSLGPNERDWLERLADVLQRHAVPVDGRSPFVTAVYSLVRACAQTAAVQADVTVQQRWRSRAEAARSILGDTSERYPNTAALQPVAEFMDAPRVSLTLGISLLSHGLAARS